MPSTRGDMMAYLACPFRDSEMVVTRATPSKQHGGHLKYAINEEPCDSYLMVQPFLLEAGASRFRERCFLHKIHAKLTDIL